MYVSDCLAMYVVKYLTYRRGELVWFFILEKLYKVQMHIYLIWENKIKPYMGNIYKVKVMKRTMNVNIIVMKDILKLM